MDHGPWTDQRCRRWAGSTWPRRRAPIHAILPRAEYHWAAEKCGELRRTAELLLVAIQAPCATSKLQLGWGRGGPSPSRHDHNKMLLVFRSVVVRQIRLMAVPLCWSLSGATVHRATTNPNNVSTDRTEGMNKTDQKTLAVGSWRTELDWPHGTTPQFSVVLRFSPQPRDTLPARRTHTRHIHGPRTT